MPQLKSAKKALVVSERKRKINDRWRRQLRDAVTALKKKLAETDETGAKEAFSTVERTLDRAARRNIIHANKAARQKSRFRKALNAITQSKA